MPMSNKSEAGKKARQKEMTLVSGGEPGSICKWQNATHELVFVPDHRYTSNGTYVVRKRRDLRK